MLPRPTTRSRRCMDEAVEAVSDFLGTRWRWDDQRTLFPNGRMPTCERTRRDASIFWRTPYVLWFVWKIPSVGFRSWSRLFPVSLPVTWVIKPAIGCHYFPPGPQLPSQPLRGLLPVSLLGEQRHDGCEQFAWDCYPTASRLRFEPRPCAWVQHANHSATERPDTLMLFRSTRTGRAMDGTTSTAAAAATVHLISRTPYVNAYRCPAFSRETVGPCLHSARRRRT